MILGFEINAILIFLTFVQNTWKQKRIHKKIVKDTMRVFFREDMLMTMQGRRNQGVQGGGAAPRPPPDFENPKKLSHRNAIKLEFFEKWGKIGLLAPP